MSGAVEKWLIIGISAATFSFAARVLFSKINVPGLTPFFLGQ